MLTDGDQSEVVAFLSRPDTYGLASRDVSRIDSHISSIFLAGDRAYKLKRAVHLSYLDFSSPARRKHFCEVELAINRRVAAGLYKRVVAITRRADGGLEFGGAGEAVDWIVEMVRFAPDATLDRVAARGCLNATLAERLADVIANFHRVLEPAKGCGGAAAMTAIVEGVHQALLDTPAAGFDREMVESLIRQQREALVACGSLVDCRAREGLVRRCHGDLHLRNIALIDGDIIPFDAIEFDETLATIDVLYDLAFLVMDLGFCHLRQAASIVINRYLDVMGEADEIAVLPLFLSLRAAVRAHVDGAIAANLAPAVTSGLIDDARRYLGSALRYLEVVPPRLIAIGGLSGSGKSRLARGLAPLIGPAPGARVVRSDVIRKQLAGVELLTRLDSQHYTRERSGQVYDALCAQASAALRAGRSVIADAVFARLQERAEIAAIAAAASVPFDGLWLDAPLAVLEERVACRQADVSDATPAVVRAQTGYNLGCIDWRRIESAPLPEETLGRAVRALAIEVS